MSEIGALIENPPIYDNLSAWENLKVRALLLVGGGQNFRGIKDCFFLTNTGKRGQGSFLLA